MPRGHRCRAGPPLPSRHPFLRRLCAPPPPSTQASLPAPSSVVVLVPWGDLDFVPLSLVPRPGTRRLVLRASGLGWPLVLWGDCVDPLLSGLPCPQGTPRGLTRLPLGGEWRGGRAVPGGQGRCLGGAGEEGPRSWLSERGHLPGHPNGDPERQLLNKRGSASPSPCPSACPPTSSGSVSSPAP